MRIFLPPIKTSIINASLTDEEFLRKNITYLDKIRSLVFVQGINNETKKVLDNLLQYFKDVEEYKYCADIMKIFEMNEDLFC